MPYIGNIVQDFSVNNAMLNTDSVTSIKIDDGTIVNADINASAAIDGSKITPTFTSTVNVTNTLPEIFLTDTNTSNARGRLNANGGGLLLGADNDNAAADSVISFAVDGSERARIDSSGHLLFAGTSEEITLQTSDGSDNGYLNLSGGGACNQNRGAQLVLNGNERSGFLGTCQLMAGNAGSASSVIQFFTGGSEQARIDASGNVGIGTTSPERQLHVLNSSGDALVRITSADGNAAYLELGDASDRDAGKIVYDNGDNLTFSTANSGSTTEKLRIQGNGKVGIGTTSPSQELEINGNIGINANLIHNGDTDTMLSFSAANQVDIVCANTTIGSFTTNGISTGINKRIDILDASGDRSGVINNSDSGANSLRISADPDNSGSSSVIGFHVDGSEKARIDSSGRVGIGTTSPATPLHIKPASNTSQLLLEQNNATDGYALFQDGPNGGHLKFMRRISGSDTQTLLLRSGGGLCFGTDNAAANALDDYEEGTWSPAVQQGVTNTQTFDSTGRYTKIGRQVYCQFLLQFSGAGTGDRVQFSGLPFTSANNTSRGGGTVLWTNIPGLNDFDFISVIVAGNATNIECYQNMDNNATTGSGGFTNKAFYARFTYEAA